MESLIALFPAIRLVLGLISFTSAMVFLVLPVILNRMRLIVASQKLIVTRNARIVFV